MNHVMRKTDFVYTKNGFRLYENKDAAAQRLCFRHIVLCLYFQNPSFKSLAIFCGYAAQFVSDLVGNPEYSFSHDTPHTMSTVRHCLKVIFFEQ